MRVSSREGTRGSRGGGGEEGLGSNPALDITIPPEAF